MLSNLFSVLCDLYPRPFIIPVTFLCILPTSSISFLHYNVQQNQVLHPELTLLLKLQCFRSAIKCVDVVRIIATLQ